MSAQPQQQVGRDGQALSRWHHAARSLKAGAHATVAGLQRWLATRRHPDYVIELIPPRAERRETLDALALENLFQSLLLTTRDPIALEVYGAPHERRLLARTRSLRSLAHLCAQLRAHAPQIEARWVAPQVEGAMAAPHSGQMTLPLPASALTHDPLTLTSGDHLRSLELCAHGGAHLPLKLYAHEELGAQGVDPLLGALAAMDGLPPGGRAVAQLALALAPEHWSRSQQRRAVEHPLAQEQARERAQLRPASATSSGGLGAAGMSALSALAPALLLALIALALYTHAIVHPFHLVHLGVASTPHTGGRPQPSWQISAVIRWFTQFASSHLAVLGMLSLVALIVLALIVWSRLRRTPIYSMRLVEERTTPIAARARITLYAIASLPTDTPTPPPGERRAPTRDSSAPGDAPVGCGRHVIRQVMHRVQHARLASSSSWIVKQHVRRARNRTLHATLDQTLLQLVAAYRQHHLASGAYFVARRGWLSPSAWRARGWARHVRHSHDLLNVRELAALWHPPQGETETPLLERGHAHALLAPVTPLADGYRIGESTQANLRTAVCLPREALRRHTLLVAKTGKGKSSLLLQLALAQLAAQHGVALRNDQGDQGEHGHQGNQGDGLVVIDPHGDLVTQLLTLIPAARRDDVLLVDLADTAYPVALNPLDALFGRDRDKAVESLLMVLSQIWSKFWGPRMQNALEYALKTLYEANETMIAHDPQGGPDQQFTLLDVAPILSAPGFRRDVLSLTQDQALRTWWTHYYQPLDFRLQLEIINPVLTKIAAFSGSRVARRIVGQSRSTLDLGAIVRSGQVLLVNTAKGVVGAETSTLIGATLLGALQSSLEEQSRVAPNERRQFLTIIDEFQTLLGVDYAALLSELRKFGGTFALATQALAHLDALDPTLRPTTLANVDALYAFSVSAEDALTLTRELDEAITPTDLINQDDFHCYAKLSLAGRRLPVFSLALDPPPVGDSAVASQLRARSRLRAARPLVTVEAALAQAAARYLPRHETGGFPTDQPDEQRPDTVPVGELSGGSMGHEANDAAVGASAPTRKAQRGRFGRPSQTGTSRSSRSVAPVFDLWSDLLGDPAMPAMPAVPSGDAHDLTPDAGADAGADEGGEEGGEEASQ